MKITFQRSSPEVTHMRKSIQTSIRRHPVVTHIRCEQAMTQEMTHHKNIAKSIHTSIHQRHPRPHHQVLCFVTWDQILEVRQHRRAMLPHRDRKHHLDHHRRTFEKRSPLLRRFLPEPMQKRQAKPLVPRLLQQQLQKPKSLTIRQQKLQKIYVANFQKKTS